MIPRFSVSEARTAIACPRIFYFDEARYRAGTRKVKQVTQLWIGASGTITGCGTLFHHTIEKFNRLAAKADDVRAALTAAASKTDAPTRTDALVNSFAQFVTRNCLNREALAKKQPPQQQAFITAVRQYLRELAEVLGYAATHGRPVNELTEEFFGDNRKRVDVTFHVGPDKDPVRVRGAIDYIFFDYRHARDQIIDYKLTPPDSPSKDLLQTALYALMHNQQHRTEPDAAVLYLHPERKMLNHPWASIYAQRHHVFDLLASMAAWAQFDEPSQTGLKPPGEPLLCGACPWSKNNQCTRRLGPTQQGERITRWSSAEATEPEVESHEPPEPAPEQEFDDFDEERDEADSATPPEPPPEATAPPFAGIAIGATTKGNQPATIPLAALNTHVSVLGAAGSGKSWLAKVVAEEAVRNGIPVLAIDPQGDLVQFLREAPHSPQATSADRQAMAAFRSRAEVRVWTPGTSHGVRLSLSPLRLPKEADLCGLDNPQRRHEEWDAMLGVCAGNLVELAQAGGDDEVQQTFLLELLRAMVKNSAVDARLELADIVAAINAPDSFGLDNVDMMIGKKLREKVGQKLFTRMRGPTANLFSGGRPLDLNAFVAPFETGKTPLNVVYLNAMPDDGQKQFFVAALAAEIYRWMITSNATGTTRLLVYLDEAKDYLPAGGSKPPAKGPLLRLFSQGRKYGVACLICTQSPRSVDYNVFSNASTKLIGRLEAAQDVQRVAEWFTDGSGAPSWLPGRNGADKGTFVGRWPEMPAALEGQEFRSRRLYSLHEGAWSPDRVEQEWKQSPLYGRLT